LIAQLNFKLLALLITLLFTLQTSYAEIGKIRTLEGPNISIKRNKDLLEGSKDSNIESMDTVETKNSTVDISFKDDTKVMIKENSKLLIDDFVFNPNQAAGGKLGLKVGFGTVRYASGQIAHSNPQAVDIQTPTATIAVRGTDFNMTVDEIGRSLVVLVPSCDQVGRCVTGKIEVMSLSGVVVLDQPYTATYVSQPSQAPIQPVKIANITDKQINNLLIVAVPKEVRAALMDKSESQKARTEAEQIEKEQISIQTKLQQKQETNSVIIIEKKNGNTIASTNNDPNNHFMIDFGTNGNASIELQRNSDINNAKVGDGGSSRITIRQTK
jgi:hypothetical protein